MKTRYLMWKSKLEKYGISLNRQSYRNYVETGFAANPHPLFHSRWYTNMYLGGDESIDPLRHYNENWESLCFDPNPLFDSRFYAKRHPGVAASNRKNILSNYIEIGAKEDHQVNIFFDPKYYRRRHPDLGSSTIDCLLHYVQHGAKELRETHPLFDPAWYLKAHEEVRASGMEALHHFTRFGIDEGRRPHALLDPGFLASQSSQVGNIRCILERYLRDPAFFRLDPHELFNSEYYYANTPGAERSTNALVHYVTVAGVYGQPNEYFDSRWYLNANPDIPIELNPLVHYLEHGWLERRKPSDAFDTDWYLRRYPDVAGSGIGPLSHYVRFGKSEGRSPLPIRTESFGVNDDVKVVTDRITLIKKESFLRSGKLVDFTQVNEPAVSIILVLFGRSHLTLECLRSIEANLDAIDWPYEVIIVDNNSPDDTCNVLDRVVGAQIIRNSENLGYLLAVNQAAPLSRGKFVLLLNNDTYLLPNSVDTACALMVEDQSVGAVGAKIILPSGVLQEAGSIVWADGSCLGYMRGSSPISFEANFRRDVDYCSGAFLLTSREIFDELGGFDQVYVPAYYEETDFCTRLRQTGKKIVYDPFVQVLHYEFGSAAAKTEVLTLQERHRNIFREKHADALASKFRSTADNVLRARHAKASPNILFIDDKVPYPQLGSGFPRARSILNELATRDINLTLVPTDDQAHDWVDVRRCLAPQIEVAFGYNGDRVLDFIAARQGHYDAVVVSRPHNMIRLNAAIERSPSLITSEKIFYDAEALFSLREVARLEMIGEPPSVDTKAAMVSEELRIARHALGVFCVSEQEADYFRRAGKLASVFGHVFNPEPGPNGFDERMDILFVGGFDGEHTPNTDSMVWFIDKVYPLIKRELPACRLLMAGINKSEAIRSRLSADVVSIGRVDDLSSTFNSCRVFVAPTRFAAGIPHKVHEAAAAGVPCVTTTLLAEQLGWTDGKQLLSASSELNFAKSCIVLYTDSAVWSRVRELALQALRADSGLGQLNRMLDRILC